MRQYIGLFPYLPDGVYRCYSKRAWHERVRIRLAAYLLKSVTVAGGFELKTVTGTVSEREENQI